MTEPASAIPQPIVPTQESVLNTLKLLFGSDVSIEDEADERTQDSVCAIYVNDDDVPVAATLCDPHFSAYAGASLSMLPKQGADAAAEHGDLPGPLLRNLEEVMLICAPLFMDDQSAHLRLGTVCRSPDDVPDEARSLVSTGQGPSFAVHIPHYGRGNVRLVVT